MLEERGLDEVVRALAAATGGAVCVLSGRGETIASKRSGASCPRRRWHRCAERGARRERASRPRAGVRDGEFAPDHPDDRRPLARAAVSLRGRGAPQAWLVAARDAGALGDFERLILQQAVTVVALELMRQRAMRDTERRLAGDVLAEALPGGCPTRSWRCGCGRSASADAAVLVFAAGRRAAPQAEAELDRFLADADVGALVATRGRLCARWSTRRDGVDPVALAGRAREAIDRRARRAARRRLARRAGRHAAAHFHEARCALEAAALANGERAAGGVIPRPGRVPAAAVAPGRRRPAALLRQRARPARGREGEYGDELIRSLEAFIEQNGQWERAARELYCHRHTLRYRIRRVEQLTGRDLSSARDRIEFWLALRARELVHDERGYDRSAFRPRSRRTSTACR